MQRIEASGQISVDQFFSRLAENFRTVRDFAHTGTMPSPYIPPSDALRIRVRYAQEATEFAQSCLQMLTDKQVAQLLIAQTGFNKNRIFWSPFPPRLISYYYGESGNQVVHFGRLDIQEEPKPIFTITTGRMTSFRQECRTRFEEQINKMYPSPPENPWQFEEMDIGETAYFQLRGQRELAAGDLTANPELFRQLLSWLDRSFVDVVSNIKNRSITADQKKEFDEMIALFHEANRLARRALGETPDKPKYYQT